MSENRINAGFQEAAGKVEDAAGGVTGDASLQAEGKMDQTIGSLKRGYSAASDRLGDAGRATRDAAQTAGNQAGAMAGKAYDAGVDAGQRMSEVVKSSPLSWLIGAIAIGYGIGFLLHARSGPWAPRQRTPRYFGR
jgi:uncharacterized protein YjbJ (UPF0337 family)